MHIRLLQGALYCAHCGKVILGKPLHQICRDGHKDGPQVPLCRLCGGPRVTCAQIWSRISRHAKFAPDRNLN
jgi:hypothetical protein